LKDKILSVRVILALSVVLFFIVFSGQAYALESSGGKWLLVNTTINPKNAPTEFYGGGQSPGFYTDKRYAGRIAEYSVDETSMSYHDHRMERGEILYFDITLKADFDKPPAVLIPGETVNLSATVTGSGSGSDKVGGGGMSLRFLYTTDGRFLEGFEQSLVIHGSVDGPGESSSRNGSFVVPKAYEGGEFKITAGLMNCLACQVEWIYQAEVAEAGQTTSTSTTSSTSATIKPWLAGCYERPKFEYYYQRYGTDTAGLESFKRDCTDSGGLYSSMGGRGTCRYCACGRVPIEHLCRYQDDPRSLEEIYKLPKLTHDPDEGASLIRMAGVCEVEGEVFLWRNGEWRGPMRPNWNIFAGDVVLIKDYGSVELCFGGSSRLRLSENTMFSLPTRKRELGWLEWGKIKFSEIFLEDSKSFDVAGGHSISGRKGTDFIMEVDEETQIATYTVREGIVEVWLEDNPLTKREVGAGESVRVTEAGIEDNLYEWDALLEESGWTDAVDSPGTPTIIDEDTDESEDTNPGAIVSVLLIIAVVAFLGYKKMRKE
jgi:hypothetical protein